MTELRVVVLSIAASLIASVCVFLLSHPRRRGHRRVSTPIERRAPVAPGLAVDGPHLEWMAQ